MEKYPGTMTRIMMARIRYDDDDDDYDDDDADDLNGDGGDDDGHDCIDDRYPRRNLCDSSGYKEKKQTPWATCRKLAKSF